MNSSPRAAPPEAWKPIVKLARLVRRPLDPLGVIAVRLLAIWSRRAILAEGLSIRHLVVLGTVAGIGFTLSLFIAQLAFVDASLLGAAKLGVLCASAIAMIAGLIIGRCVLPFFESEQDRRLDEPAAAT